tara:strand:- start:123 stop:692 length:570 start_codon:yes stop_codon:yes gene_type:complete
MTSFFELETKRKSYQFWRVLFVTAAKYSWISLTIIASVMMATFVALITADQSVVQASYSIDLLFFSFIAMIAALGGHFSLRCYMRAVDEDVFTDGYRAWFERLRQNRPFLEIIPVLILHVLVLGMFLGGILYQILVFGLAGYAFATSFNDIRHDIVCDAELTRVLSYPLYQVSGPCNDFVSRYLSSGGS